MSESPHLHDLVARILRHEGFRARVYDDATGRELEAGDTVRGVPTIGHGITVLTPAESEVIVRLKVGHIRDELRERVPGWDGMPENVRDVLTEMAYQMGVEGTLGFRRALEAAREADWSRMANEMLDSLWARQTPSRAEALAAIVRTA